MAFQRNLIFYINFIKDLNFIPVILAPFLMSKGLSLSDLMLVLSAFRITQMVLSIPTGLFSDIYGPVLTLRIASFFVLASIIVLIPENLNLYNFLFFNILSATSVSLLGSSTSKLLKNIEPHEESFFKNLSKTLALRRLGIVSSGFVASLILMFFKYEAVVWLQSVFGLGLIYISFKVDINLNHKPDIERMISHIKQGIVKAPYMQIASTAVVGVTFFVTFDIFLQPLLLQAKISKALFPFILAFYNLAIFFSLNYVKKFERIFHKNIVSSTLLSLTPLLAYVVFENALLSLIAMVVPIIMRPVAVKETVKLVNSNPSYNQGLNDSLTNTFSTGITAFYSLLFGYCLKFYSFKISTAIMFFILLTCCLLFFMLKSYLENEKKLINNP